MPRLGHSLHFGSISMSGLPPTTTESRTFENGRNVPDSVLIIRRRRRPVFLRGRKDTACGAVARPMRYFDLAAKVVGPPGRGRQARLLRFAVSHGLLQPASS